MDDYLFAESSGATDSSMLRRVLHSVLGTDSVDTLICMAGLDCLSSSWNFVATETTKSVNQAKAENVLALDKLDDENVVKLLVDEIKKRSSIRVDDDRIVEMDRRIDEYRRSLEECKELLQREKEAATKTIGTLRLELIEKDNQLRKVRDSVRTTPISEIENTLHVVDSLDIALKASQIPNYGKETQRRDYPTNILTTKEMLDQRNRELAERLHRQFFPYDQMSSLESSDNLLLPAASSSASHTATLTGAEKKLELIQQPETSHHAGNAEIRSLADTKEADTNTSKLRSAERKIKELESQVILMSLTYFQLSLLQDVKDERKRGKDSDSALERRYSESLSEISKLNQSLILLKKKLKEEQDRHSSSDLLRSKEISNLEKRNRQIEREKKQLESAGDLLRKKMDRFKAGATPSKASRTQQKKIPLPAPDLVRLSICVYVSRNRLI